MPTFMVFPALAEAVRKGERRIFPMGTPLDPQNPAKSETDAVLQIGWQMEKAGFPVKVTVVRPNGSASAPPLISLLTVNQCIF